MTFHIQANMLLTICVPTLNRAPRVAALVSHLRDVLARQPAGEIEILVSDNCSTDDTWNRLSALPAMPNMRLVRREVPLATGEEHFIQLVAESMGEFVWVLGDDDLPNYATLQSLLGFLRARTAIDIYVFNHREITQDGSILTETMLQMNAPWMDISGRQLMRATGFISTLSMFSNVVFRRSAMQIDVGRQIMASTPIYSHVAWYMDSFALRRARVVNAPLVNHRADFASIQSYFAKYSELNAHGRYYIWTVGLISHFKHFMSRGILSADDISRIVEHEFDGRRYRLIDKIAHYIYLQIEAAAADAQKSIESSREIFPAETFDDIYATVLAIEPAMQDQFFLLRSMHQLTLSPVDFSKRAYREIKRQYERLHSAQTAWNLNGRNRLGIFYGFAVYQTLAGFAAVSHQALSRGLDLEQVLGFLDPVELGDWVLVDATLERLMERLPMAAANNARHEINAAQASAALFPNVRSGPLSDTIYYSLTPLRWFGKLAVLLHIRGGAVRQRVQARVLRALRA